MRIGGAFSLAISKEGHLLYSENFRLKDEKFSEPFSITVTLQKIELGRKAVLNNIFFESNKYNLLPESKIELGELITFLTENSHVEIEIQGHTDNIGSDGANQLLSENRAKSVYDYLILNGINSSKLSYKGYGASYPISDNTTEEGRRMNRRTEFKITKK
jgi:outer membrane protein OmpA-like peptidoglycan-associated protein